MWIPKHLLLQQFPGRSAAFSHINEGVLIFLVMTVVCTSEMADIAPSMGAHTCSLLIFHKSKLLSWCFWTTMLKNFTGLTGSVLSEMGPCGTQTNNLLGLELSTPGPNPEHHSLPLKYYVNAFCLQNIAWSTCRYLPHKPDSLLIAK